MDPTGRLPIRRWVKGERPRERLKALGPGALSTRELLAILVGSGGRSGSAMDVADGLLQDLQRRWPEEGRGGSGALRRLAGLPLGVLEGRPGIGAATAARIAAAVELGRRIAVEPGMDDPAIRGPADVFARLGPHLRDLAQEEFHALLLNTQHRIVRGVLITRGILDASLIHPREVFRMAIVESAAGMILVHNHPSGDPTPSREDRMVTDQLVKAGEAVGIPVLDHVIIGDSSFVSLAERGWVGNG